MTWYPFKGLGRLAAFTCITVCPPQMTALGYGRDNPYCVGVVQLDEGPRGDARIIGVDSRQPETINIGSLMTIEYLPPETENGSPVLGFRPIKT